MLATVDNNIYLTRGDTADINVIIKDNNGEVYNMQSGDVLRFTIKINCITTDIVIQKTVTNNTISLDPEDTENLNYGSYWFDLELTTAGGDVYTVLAPHRFNLCDEVTFTTGD